jgi:CheY-like chemotaxis protein
MTSTAPSRPLEVLLVEDNPGEMRLMREAFREHHSESRLRLAVNGSDAMAILRREGRHGGEPLPDLILLDLNLPGKNGREVLAEVKSDPELRHIPIVVLTTSRSEEDIRQAYALNANCYITKPFDLDEFLSVVRSIQSFWLHLASLPRRE